MVWPGMVWPGMVRSGILILLLAVVVPLWADDAATLRNRGIAELENETPAEAEATFRRLTELDGDEPLGHANLAIALLRQQKHDNALASIEQAIRHATSEIRPELLWIRAEIHQARDDIPAALADLGQASRLAPEDVEIQYALFQLANLYRRRDDDAHKQFAPALERLRELRPENLLVLLELGLEAIANQDRTAATGAYLRLSEVLSGQSPPAEELLGTIHEALNAGDVSAARVPARRLANLLKPTPMYQGSLGELRTAIQGHPILRLRGEPPPRAFGAPASVRFDGSVLGEGTTLTLLTADFDSDEVPDVARLVAAEPPHLEIRLGRDTWEPKTVSVPKSLALVGLQALDLDNAGRLDLLGYGPGGLALWRGDGTGDFTSAELPAGLSASGSALAAFDFDVEGDLDLAFAGPGSELALRRNANVRFDIMALPSPSPKPSFTDAVATDLDRDGDLDLLLASDRGLHWLDNLRQGRFADRTERSGLAAVGGPVRRVASADFDGDGDFDLVTAGKSLGFWRGDGERFTPWAPLGDTTGPEDLDTLLVFEANNDGRLDVAVAGSSGVTLLGQREDGTFAPLSSRSLPAGVTALSAADLDGDGDLDLVAGGGEGLHWLKNRGGDRNRSLVVRLRGLVKGNSKNNYHGLGATLELMAGDAYQLVEVHTPTTLLGLGSLDEADLLRIVWTNGVPEIRFEPKKSESIVEEQSLKGSCPFLYTWDGEGFTFVTDLLWGAPIGMPVAPGVWASPDPKELVKVEGARPGPDGRWRLRVTEELWEAAFFDYLRLWVVDHPPEVEVASNLRILPGRKHRPAVLASRSLRGVVDVYDGRGREVSDRVAQRDDVYADGYEPSPYQGVATRPWTFTFDLGAAPAAPVRLHLDGWIFPSDASLNLAIAQRGDLELVSPRLEMEVAGSWQVLMADVGLPPGKTKTMVVDTPPLPAGVRRLRIVTSHWLHWDRIAWTTEPAPEAFRVAGVLAPERAELAFRGFSARLRRAPNAPHGFDYASVSTASPWLPLPGRYTRYGDVRDLLEEPDSRSVILAAGDELELTFAALTPPQPGWRRTVFLESHGWDKDADRNTWEGHRLEPLPFRGMSGYPGAEGETFPSTPELEDYRRQWLTRRVDSLSPAASVSDARSEP